MRPVTASNATSIHAKQRERDPTTLSLREVALPQPHWNIQKHLTALDTSFAECPAAFESRRIFSGPSVCFYEQVIKLVRNSSSLSDLSTNGRLVALA